MTLRARVLVHRLRAHVHCPPRSVRDDRCRAHRRVSTDHVRGARRIAGDERQMQHEQRGQHTGNAANGHTAKCKRLPAPRPVVYRLLVRHSLRSRAICSSLVLALLNLVLVSSGFPCTLPMHGMTAGEAMAGMPMGDEAGASVLPNTAPPANTPCRFPWAPGGCQSMAPCAPAAVQSGVVMHSMPAIRAERALHVDVATPESLTRAPEPPPPRA